MGLDRGFIFMLVMAGVGMVAIMVVSVSFGTMGISCLLGVPPAMTVETIGDGMYVRHQDGYHRVDTSVVYTFKSVLAALAER